VFPLVARQHFEIQRVGYREENKEALLCPSPDTISNMDTKAILAELKDERNRVQQAIDALRGLGGKTVRLSKTKTGRHMSADARRRIGLAMKKRWAERKKAS
jgi:hypothetical protein